MVSIVFARGNEPLISRDVIQAEQRFPVIEIQLNSYEHREDVEPRIRRVVGSVRITDRYGRVVGFYVRTTDTLIVDPRVPRELVDVVVERVKVLKRRQAGILAVAYRLIALAAATVAAGDGPAEVTPEKAVLCGIEVTPENIYRVMADDSLRGKMEACLSEHLAKLLGTSAFRVAGVDVTVKSPG